MFTRTKAPAAKIRRIDIAAGFSIEVLPNGCAWLISTALPAGHEVPKFLLPREVAHLIESLGGSTDEG